jgi:hypothetical protein
VEELIKLIIGTIMLFFAIPIGSLLAKMTKEELKAGRLWFKLIVYCSLAGGIFGLIMQNDFLMFSFFFIAIVTSKSLKN